MRQKHDSLHLLHVPLVVDKDCHSFVDVVAGGLAEVVTVVVEPWKRAVAPDDEEEASELEQAAHKSVAASLQTQESRERGESKY